MSLVVHLPLNGTIDNLGDSVLTFQNVSSSNTVVSIAGKFYPKNYYNNSFTAGGLISNQAISLGSNQTMCCWAYISSLMSSSNLGGGLVTQHRYYDSAPSNMGLTIKYVTSSTGYISVNTAKGTTRTYNTYCGSTLLTSGKWYHLAYTYDGSTIRLYVNGKLDGSHAFSGQVLKSDYIGIFAWSMSGASDRSLYGNYKFNGYLSDVRIYNDTRTQAEIQDIMYESASDKNMVVRLDMNTSSSVNRGTEITNFAASSRNIVALGKNHYNCLRVNSTNHMWYNGTKHSYTKNFSWSVWAKQEGNCSSTIGYIFCEGRADAGGYGVGLRVPQTGNIIVAHFGSNIINYSVNTFDWHHYAGVIDNDSNISFYVDGNLVGKMKPASLPTYLDAGLTVGGYNYSGSSIYPFNGLIEDFKLWDRQISLLEIKKLSQAPVAHFKLSRNYPNLLNSDFLGTFSGTCNAGSYTDFKVWNSIVTPGANTHFTVSFDAWSNVNNVRMANYLYNNNSGRQCDDVKIYVNGVNTYNGSSTDGYAPCYLYKQKQHFVIVRHFNSNATALAKNLLFRNYPISGSGIINYISNIKLEFSDHETLGLNTNSTNEYDYIGNSQDATINGGTSMVRTSQSPRNRESYYFNGINTYIACGQNAKVTDEITVGVWVCSYSGNVGRPISCTENGGWNFEDNANGILWEVYAGGTYRFSYATGYRWDSFLDSWHYLVGTWDGYKASIYIDGDLKGTSKPLTAKTPITYNASNGIFIGAEAGSNTTTPAGSYWKGYLSDVRIFGKALTRDEILDIYNNSLKLDDFFRLHCSDYKRRFVKEAIVSHKFTNDYSFSLTNTTFVAGRKYYVRVQFQMLGDGIETINKCSSLGFIAYGADWKWSYSYIHSSATAYNERKQLIDWTFTFTAESGKTNPVGTSLYCPIINNAWANGRDEQTCEVYYYKYWDEAGNVFNEEGIPNYSLPFKKINVYNNGYIEGDIKRAFDKDIIIDSNINS